MIDTWPFFLLLACGAFYLLRVTGGLTRFPGDLGDARFNQVILEHLYRYATGRAEYLWSPDFFFPFSGTLAFSDNHFGTGVFYVVWRLLGASREVAFDLWYCLGMLFSYFAAFHVLRRSGFPELGAAAGALVFAFGLPALAQEGHAQLAYRFPIPYAAFEFLAFLSSYRRERLLRAALFVAVQFLASIYLGVFLDYLLGSLSVAHVLYCVVSRGSLFSKSGESTVENRSRSFEPLVLAMTLSAWALVLGMLHRYHAISRAYGVSRPADEILSMLPRISSYFIADASPISSWVGAWAVDIPMRHEHQLFVGIGAFALAAAGVSFAFRDSRWRRLGGVYFGALAILVLATLSVGGLSLYRLAVFWPGINAIRAVSRVSLVELLPIAVLTCIGVTGLVETLGRRRMFVQVALACLVMIEVVFHVPASTEFAAARERIFALDHFAALAPRTRAQDVLLLIGPDDGTPIFQVQIDAMVFAQDQGVKTLNGYSGHFAPGFVEARNCSDASRWLERIRAYKGRQQTRLGDRPDFGERIWVLPDRGCTTSP